MFPRLRPQVLVGKQRVLTRCLDYGIMEYRDDGCGQYPEYRNGDRDMDRDSIDAGCANIRRLFFPPRLALLLRCCSRCRLSGCRCVAGDRTECMASGWQVKNAIEARRVPACATNPARARDRHGGGGVPVVEPCRQRCLHLHTSACRCYHLLRTCYACRSGGRVLRSPDSEKSGFILLANIAMRPIYTARCSSFMSCIGNAVFSLHFAIEARI